MKHTWIALTLGLAFVSRPAAAQEAEIEIEDVRLGYMGHYKPGDWIPVGVDLKCKTPGASFTGLIEFRVPDSDGLMTSSFIEAFANYQQGRTSFIHAVKVGTADSVLTVRLLEQEGGVVARRRVELATNQSLRVMDLSQDLYLMYGSPAGLYEAAENSKKVIVENQHAVRIASLEMIPTQWFAYGSTHAVVMATRSSTYLERMGRLRESALETWVRQGGRLIVCVAGNHQLVADSFLARLLPAKLTGVRRLREPSMLEAFTKSDVRFDVGKQGLEIAAVSDVRGEVVVGDVEAPLVIDGSYGLGRVTLVTFDADEAPFMNWDGRQDFWIELLGFERYNETAEKDQQRRRMSVYTVSDLSTLVATHLENFPDVTVVPFGWVALLILGYILLIGPIDYFFLKKVVGRLELTWITFPFWVVTISVAAYFAAHWLKGDMLRVNRVEIVDVDVDSQTLRGASFISIFSPRIDKYTLAVEPNLAAAGQWSDLGMGKEQATRVASWMGIPEAALGGTYNQGAVGLFGQRGYAYQSPQPTSVIEVPVQVWSVKTLMAHWIAQAKPSLKVDASATERSLSGSITNLLDVPLKDAYIAYGPNVQIIGTIQPNQSIALGGGKLRGLSDFLRDSKLNFNEYSLRRGYQTLRANDFEAVVRGLMFTDKMPEKFSQYGNKYFHQLDLSHQLDLGKAVLVAKVEQKTGGALWLNPPKLPESGTQQEPPAIDGNVKTQTYLRLVFQPEKHGG